MDIFFGGHKIRRPGAYSIAITENDTTFTPGTPGPNPYEPPPLPAYWQEHFTQKLARIQQLQNEDPVNRLTIGVITDMHIERNNDMNSGNLMSRIDAAVNLSVVINGGDTLAHHDGRRESREDAISQIDRMFGMFSPSVKAKMLYAFGNHDDNTFNRNKWDVFFNHLEAYNVYFKHLEGSVAFGPSPKYYYKDDVAHKVRFIILNSIDIPYILNEDRGDEALYKGDDDYVFSQEQLTWFSEVALNVPNDRWAVYVVSHVPPFREGVSGYHLDTINADLALGIIGAFKNKTTFVGTSPSEVNPLFQASVSVDFTGGGGEVIAWHSGHTHTDNIASLPSGIKLLTTLNDHKNRKVDTTQQGTSGTISEQAFDIITIDRDSKQVYLTRIGQGNDREYRYTQRDYPSGATIFEDNFNRADSATVGGEWNVVKGAFVISNNRAKATIVPGEATNNFMVVDSGVYDNISIEADIEPNDGEAIVVRFTNDENFIRAMIEKDKTMNISVTYRAARTELASKAFNWASGTTYRVKVELIGETINFYINGNLELTGTTSRFLAVTNHGIRAVSISPTNGAFDNFSIKKL